MGTKNQGYGDKKRVSGTENQGFRDKKSGRAHVGLTKAQDVC